MSIALNYIQLESLVEKCVPFTSFPILKLSLRFFRKKSHRQFTIYTFSHDYTWATGGHFRTLSRIFKMFPCVCWEKTLADFEWEICNAFPLILQKNIELMYQVKNIINQFDYYILYAILLRFVLFGAF